LPTNAKILHSWKLNGQQQSPYESFTYNTVRKVSKNIVENTGGTTTPYNLSA